ncbi:hypothetical protein GWK47_019504 [Chionoecetes opilio]|uniref:Uncharacterized protein n=1 Tax=Chionoecetes opilio TaxID=41210 RepID=A0A8J4XQ99_CHIOP|nr:hypothetical protein GWK47_019504 [Chionoecetes opilio]
MPSSFLGVPAARIRLAENGRRVLKGGGRSGRQGQDTIAFCFDTRGFEHWQVKGFVCIRFEKEWDKAVLVWPAAIMSQRTLRMSSKPLGSSSGPDWNLKTPMSGSFGVSSQKEGGNWEVP